MEAAGAFTAAAVVADFMEAGAVGFTAEEDSPAEGALASAAGILLAGIAAEASLEVAAITAAAGMAGATAGAAEVGAMAGAEVVQLYVGIPSTAVPEPPKWLKGFQKISLTPGQTGQVQLALDERSFSYWDVNTSSWLVVPETYKIMVGSSSRDIRMQAQITVN